MAQSGIDLSKLFGAAMNAINENRDGLNSMDEENHPNHGDNVHNNLNVIKNALQSQKGQNPSDALRAAAEAVQKNGRGSTAPHYAEGLQQAADQFEGKDELDQNDIAALLSSMLGTGVQQPAQQATAGEPISSLLGLIIGGQQPQQAAAQPQPGGAQSSQDILGKVLPAGMAFMNAKASGADTKTAAIQAAMSALTGSNPLQAGSSRGASNGLIAQGVMRALMSSLG
jgi:hypothetical protein